MMVGETVKDEVAGGEIRGYLARIQAGDQQAAGELLGRYEAEVRLVVRRQLPRMLRSRFDSVDFLQSVWGSFFHRVRTVPTEFEDGRHLVAFLARAAKNKVIDEFRKAGSQKQDMRREEPIWSDGDKPRDLAAFGETASQVAEAREAFDQIEGAVADMTARIESIAAAAQQITATTERVSEDITGVASVAESSSATAEQVSASTQETSASAEEISASAQELSSTAQLLEQLIGRFTVRA